MQPGLRTSLPCREFKFSCLRPAIAESCTLLRAHLSRQIAMKGSRPFALTGLARKTERLHGRPYFRGMKLLPIPIATKATP